MPPLLIIVLAIFLLIFLLLSLRINLVLSYRDTVTLHWRVLCFRFPLYPRKKKFKIAKKRRKKGASAAVEATESTPQEPLSLRESLALLRAVTAAVVRKADRHLRLRLSVIDVRVATGDAATTAVLYGAICQSISYILAFLSRIASLRASKHSVCVHADYLAEHSSARIKIVFSTSVWGFIVMLFSSSLAQIKAREALKRKRLRRARASAALHKSDTKA